MAPGCGGCGDECAGGGSRSAAAAAAAAATAEDLEAMRESMENADAFRLKVDEALEADTDRDAAEVVKGCFECNAPPFMSIAAAAAAAAAE